MASAYGAAKHNSVAIAIPLPIALNPCLAFPCPGASEKWPPLSYVLSADLPILVVFRRRRETGAAVLTGLDRHVEAVLVTATPNWLTAFATSL